VISRAKSTAQLSNRHHKNPVAVVVQHDDNGPLSVPAGATVHFTNTRTSVRTVTAGTPTAVGQAFAEVLNGEGSTVDVVIEHPASSATSVSSTPFMRREIVAV
jgi:hypothetical protein